MFIICIDDSVSPQGWFADTCWKKKTKPAEGGLLVFTVQQAIPVVLEEFWTVVNQLDTRLIKLQDQINQIKPAKLYTSDWKTLLNFRVEIKMATKAHRRWCLNIFINTYYCSKFGLSFFFFIQKEH